MTELSSDSEIRLELGSGTVDDVVGSTVLEAKGLNVFYGRFQALTDINLQVSEHQITALIGPSGCGKSTLLRSFNRMNDLVAGARVEGSVRFGGEDLYAKSVDPIEVRRRIGMVFQKPNPFPKSIYDNVAFGPKVQGISGSLDAIVEDSLRKAALWDEVKGKLKASGLSLSGGQQQRLCIARALAVNPDVILMDEPCSALDPFATDRIEQLMKSLSDEYTIVIVTHNMQQAARVSNRTAFLTTKSVGENDQRTGVLVEFDLTQKIFSNPEDQRTADYVAGRFG